MKYSFLLLVVCVFFSRCKEWEEKKITVPVEAFSLEGLYKEVRKIDTAAAMLHFTPDTAAFTLYPFLLEDFYPDRVDGLHGNVESITETELWPREGDRMEESLSREYVFENGLLTQITDNDEEDGYVETMEYDSAGFMTADKTVYPGDEDSVVKEYQYDAQKRLIKVLHFDVLNKLVKTTHFFYHKNGNLDSMWHEDSENENYTYRYYFNAASSSFLKVHLSEKGKINWAIFYRLNDGGKPVFDEFYDKTNGITIKSNNYTYDKEGNLAKAKMMFPAEGLAQFTQSYVKRDAAGNWTEMLSYENGDLYSITRRKISYRP